MKEKIFAAQAADLLVEGLAACIDDIPEDGPFKDVYSNADADEIYGDGWTFAEELANGTNRLDVRSGCQVEQISAKTLSGVNCL